MERTQDDLARAAAAAGAVLLATKMERLRDGSWTLAGTFGFEDPWAAARLLCILAEEDAQDPAVRAYGRDILEHVAAAYGTTVDDPSIQDAFVQAVHQNVQQWIRFAPEEGERFQSARTTMIEGVGDCDCHARLAHALARSQGAPSEIRFFEDAGEPVHAVAAFGTSGGPQWAETTIGAYFGEHPQEAYRRLGLDRTGARPDIGGAGDASHDDMVALQTRLQDLTLATSLAVEACRGLSSEQLAQWSTLAGQILGFVSGDPGVVDYDLGQQLATELASVATELRAAGCAAPIPAPIPKPAPKPSSNNPFEGIAGALKAVAVVVGLVAGAVVVVKVLDVMPKRRSLTA